MSHDVVYIDSAEEQLAYLISRFGSDRDWVVADQRLAEGENGRLVERSRFETPTGTAEVEFREARQLALSDDADKNPSAKIDAAMKSALAFAATNPPHHPGSLPRFPVPVEHYKTAVGVPLTILAVDDLGQRGIYAPPRMAVVRWTTMEPIGVRDFPDFDPAVWPPRRLGDWPSRTAARLAVDQLGATITRFSACWARLIDAWFGIGRLHADVTRADAKSGLQLRDILDPATMQAVYQTMNSRFAEWLSDLTRE